MKSTRTTILGLAIGLVFAATALGQSGSGYIVSHQFNVSPEGGFLVLPTVTGGWSTYAQVYEGAQTDIDSDSGNPVFTEALSTAGGSSAAGAPKAPFIFCSASAGASISVAQFDDVGVSGSVGSSGSTQVTSIDPLDVAWANSAAAIQIYGGRTLRRGVLTWSPYFSTSVSGSAGASGTGIMDPITIEVKDAGTGEVLLAQESFFDVFTDLYRVDSLTWDADRMKIDGDNVILRMVADSPYTPENGVLNFKVHDGIVTQSEATGLFSVAELPLVDATGPFDFAFPNTFTLHYDVGDFEGRDLDVGLTFDGGGNTVAPEPATLALLVSGVAILVRRRRQRAARGGTGRRA
jgi:hypothetical protein